MENGFVTHVTGLGGLTCPEEGSDIQPMHVGHQTKTRSGGQGPEGVRKSLIDGAGELEGGTEFRPSTT